MTFIPLLDLSVFLPPSLLHPSLALTLASPHRTRVRRRSARSRTADSGIPAGFRLSARAVLLRLVAGPVTNHDSSARERRGHTTLGSGSGACCPPPRAASPPFDRARVAGRLRPPLSPACHPPAQLLRFTTKSDPSSFEKGQFRSLLSPPYRLRFGLGSFHRALSPLSPLVPFLACIIENVSNVSKF